MNLKYDMESDELALNFIDNDDDIVICNMQGETIIERSIDNNELIRLILPDFGRKIGMKPQNDVIHLVSCHLNEETHIISLSLNIYNHNYNINIEL